MEKQKKFKKDLSFLHPFLTSSRTKKTRNPGGTKTTLPIEVKFKKFTYWNKDIYMTGHQPIINQDPITGIILVCGKYGDCQVWKSNKKMIEIKLPYYGKSSN